MMYVESTTTETIQVNGNQNSATQKPAPEPPKKEYQWEFVWRNIILYIIMHLAGLVGVYFIVTGNCSWKTVLWMVFLLQVGLHGITAGVHRLWTHRSYKATLPLKILLCVMQTIALQNSIYDWARDHRVHHKYVDTDADPHNSRRGLFFSHMGWLFIKPQKDNVIKTAQVDLSDLHQDAVVMFQYKYYFIAIAPVIGFFLPAWIPTYLWNENFWVSFFVSTMLRYALTTNFTFLVNSFAHIYGDKPYDKNINPTDNITVTMLTTGEGWHNYHHTFPWDYKAGELGRYSTNTATGFIDLMAKIGWAYDLKTASVDMIKKRVKRTGDGTRVFEDADDLPVEHVEEEKTFWGWGDQDMTDKDLKFVEVHHHRD